MSVEFIEPKYPILDDIKIPEKLMEDWQTTVDIMAKIARIPAALLMRVHDRDEQRIE